MEKQEEAIFEAGGLEAIEAAGSAVAPLGSRTGKEDMLVKDPNAPDTDGQGDYDFLILGSGSVCPQALRR
jgi:hypothetical protein